MALRLYNTLARTIENFDRVHPDQMQSVGLYTCGPTVYDYAHIGNMRKYLFDDVLERTLSYLGYRVTRVMNITDVGHLTSDSDEGDDKLEIAARREARGIEELIQHYTDAFTDDLRLLNIRVPEHLPRASNYVPQQLQLIEQLIARGMAYDTPEAVYFNTSLLPDYGKLTTQRSDERTVGARSEVVTETSKRNPADFALWFKLVGRFEHHVQHWPSPWGVGFPGWHIECSAIGRALLGQPFDIHTGGVDHIFPHHTNEIAQSEGAYGDPLAHLWMHSEFMMVDGQKMSKSTKAVNNVYLVRDIVERGYDPLALRYLVLGAHYRARSNFTWEALTGAARALEHVHRAYWSVLDVPAAATLGTAARRFQQAYIEAISDDLNTARTLATLHEIMSATDLPTAERRTLFEDLDRILGILVPLPTIPEQVQQLVAERAAARGNEQFIQSDALREQISALGYVVEDRPDGTTRVLPTAPHGTENNTSA